MMLGRSTPGVVGFLLLAMLSAVGCQSSPTGSAPSPAVSPASPAASSASPRTTASGGLVTYTPRESLQLPGLTPFARLAAPPDSPGFVMPADESVGRYETQLDALRVTPEKTTSYILYLRGRMKGKVDRFSERLKAVKEVVDLVPTLDKPTYDKNRNELALELRNRVGVLYSLRMQAAGRPWPPPAASGAPSEAPPSSAPASPSASAVPSAAASPSAPAAP